MTTLTLTNSDIDTHIIDATPDTNNATAIQAFFGERTAATSVNRFLIKFDLSALPADAVISSTTLSLYFDGDASSNARTLRVYRVKRVWVEAEATWNIYSTGNSWSTAGGFHADDCEQTDIGSKDLTATETLNEFKAISLTPTTKADLDLGNGWLLKMDTESDDAYRVRTSEHTTSANRPMLEIVYTQGGGPSTIIRSPMWGRF